MQIPAFLRPSNPDDEIIFRMPTVADAMSWANAVMDTEEANTTRYLREMLEVPGSSDPLLWTVQDRRTALWWIFINSRVDPKITVEYLCDHCKSEPCQKCVDTGKGNECQHCKETHHYDCDLSILMNTSGVLTVEPFLAVELPVDGEIREWLIKPLDGRAIEHLERARALLPPKTSPDYKQEVLNLSLLELAHQAHLADQPDDFMEAAELRYNLIQSMAIDTEFSLLVANVELAKRQLNHGLDMRVELGEVVLTLPPHRCTTIAKEKGEANAPVTPLFTPFRAGYFLPIIGSGGVGDAG